MRMHLLSCFQNNFFTPFPKSEEPGEFVGGNAVIYAQIFCSCRGTFFKSDLSQDADMIMVKCGRCDERYHKKCHNVPAEVFRDRKLFKAWICANCS